MNVRAIGETRAVKFVRAVGEGFVKHDDMSLAAAVAFYMVVSFAPLVLLIVALGGFLGGSAQSSLIRFFNEQMGPRASEVTQSIVESAQREQYEAGSWRWVLGMILLLISASAVFAQLQNSLNTIWETNTREKSSIQPAQSQTWFGRTLARLGGIGNYVRKRLISLGMVLASMFILLVSLVLSSVAEHVMPAGEGIPGRIAVVVVSFVVAMLLFCAIFRVLPDRQISWREVWLGGTVTAALFSVGKFVLGMYLEHGGVAQGYGKAAGALIALVVWIYYSCVILFIGAEITRYIGSGKGEPQDVGKERVQAR